jgi:phosphoribosyl 1,2-cyclic phosphodiesterase
MITITPIASSSAGNCYHVTDGKTPLLIEAGARPAKVREKIGNIAELAGCLVSHSHGDHSKYIKDLIKAAVDCYMSAGTADALGLQGHRIHGVKEGEQFKIGTWTIKPFDTVHDAQEPLGFLLGSGDEKLLFATDTAYIPHRFQGLTNIMIECNYNKEVLEANVESGAVSVSQKKRLLFSHFGLDQVLEFLRVTDRSRLREVWLLHASNANSDVAQMKAAVQGLTGVPTYIAEE